MTEIGYRAGTLHVEEVPAPHIADEVGTPVYVYSSAVLERQYRAFAAALAHRRPLICYALKANSNQAVIATFAALGAGADIVSEGEMRRALAAGVPPGRIVFAGVGKTRGEMDAALAAGILQFNVESEPELDALAAAAVARGTTAPVVLRVNPDVDAKTHAKITTGKSENKFGIEIAAAMRLARGMAARPGLRFAGLAMHIGSQLTETGPYRDAFAKLAGLARTLIGEGVAVERLDLGGGLGVSYQGQAPFDLAGYARIVDEAVGDLPVQLICEPGRFLVAEAGLLLTRVIYEKHGTAKRFVIVDGAMNDLIRPTLYEAFHPVWPVAAPAEDAAATLADLVGPICESGDVLARDRALPPLPAGSLVAVGYAGAYGAVMASTYNSRPLVAEVLVRGDEVAVIRPRQDFATLIGQDRLPGWLAPAAPLQRRRAP